MKFIIAAFFGLFINYSAYAISVSGRVVDENGSPLPFASIYIKGTNKGATANGDGYYYLDLADGNYLLRCEHVGYSKQEKNIKVEQRPIVVDFVLQRQIMSLQEVVLKKGEDPAYAIIREAIKKRKDNLRFEEHYIAKVYSKGQFRLRNFPKKFLGDTLDFRDGDTSKKKILFLSETISDYYVDKPNREKVIVQSSRVSGSSDAFGLAVPTIFSIYNNTLQLSPQLNPRGFISPIADNALNYYKFKFVGSYIEDGREVDRIQVIPRRKFEPVFSGFIEITPDDYSVHSTSLQLLKESQLQLLDSLKLEQLYSSVSPQKSFIKSQVISIAVKKLGFDAYGSFLNVYSDVEIDPIFPTGIFNKTIIKYSDSSNKKTLAYWDQIRPLQLLPDESRDYHKKDSLEQLRKSPHYLDSLNKINNHFTIAKLLMGGLTLYQKTDKTIVYTGGIVSKTGFNPAEGLVFSPSFFFDHTLDSSGFFKRKLAGEMSLRYGFVNKHFNPLLKLSYRYGKANARSLTIHAGSSVFQFNNHSAVSELSNSLSCLLYEDNRIKSYEASLFKFIYNADAGNGFRYSLGFEFQDRKPLENLTNYTWRNEANKEYTPNFPYEIVSSNISRHQVFTVDASVRFQPGVHFIEFPGRKVNIGSNLPVFQIQFKQAIPKLFGSDAKFSKWNFSVTDELNAKLKGIFRYKIGVGGFVNKKQVPLPDYTHFNGNTSTLATGYLNSFQLLPLYLYSNTNAFYSLAHVEYNAKGFLTNKIPIVRQANIYLVAGGNALWMNRNKYYYETFIGIDNILKQIRIDYVQSYNENGEWQSGIRIGVSSLQ